ncbi:MAG: hypothetical protein KatS3mg076_1371 [Candidatus Binatia bacterium]|nr:MAG: hypothetical protein KatS3mg076_1371 [Candidatus Binatia bacterium]
MPDFRHRLNARQRRVYDRSNQVSSVRLPTVAKLRVVARALFECLPEGKAREVQALTQELADLLTAALRVPPVSVAVGNRRPSNMHGELHGLYLRPERGSRARIRVWMRTAKRKQVVAFRTYLRTFLHEICHHLDYELLRLPDSFHTDGFYRREASLFRQLWPFPREHDTRPAAPPLSHDDSPRLF